ncbi:MAG: hypothetical protein JW993_14585 [Sedimentisphaerales bacterium]|nr:hypothetical protein [Sedimentisphaerales bacterium]
MRNVPEIVPNDLEVQELLARAEREIEAGTGYDLDTVLAEADLVRQWGTERLRAG